MLLKILFILPICAKTLAQTDPTEAPKACPDGFDGVGQQCVHLLMESIMTETAALFSCMTKGQGTTLLTISENTEQLVTIIKHLEDKGKNESFWIAGSDASHEGYWTSTKGDIPMGTPFWLATETIAAPEGGSQENCAEMAHSNGFLINDANCNALKFAICENTPALVHERTSVNIPETLHADIQCPLFYVNIGGKCFSLITWEVVTWEEVDGVCRGFGGHPAIIDEISILRDFYNYVNDQGIATHSYWTSGTMDTNDKWIWYGGSAVPEGSPFWGNSDVKQYLPEPDGEGLERCLALTAEGQYYFRDKVCSELMSPLCMADPITP